MKWWRSIKQGIRNIKDFRVGRWGDRGNVQQQVQGTMRPSGPINQLLDEYYDEVGPKHLKLAVRFVLGPDGRLKSVLHGLWPEPRVILTISQLKEHKTKLLGEKDKFEDLLLMYGHLMLARWPDSKDPTSLEAAISFSTRQWKKHGQPAGMSRLMYFYHGLALMSAIPENFDIPVDVPMTLDEVGRRAQAVVRDLHLFGDHIGADVMPEIVAGMDPNNPTGPFLLKEIRVHLERTLKEGRGVYRIVAVDDGKCFTGKANSGNNIVILPSSSSS